MASDLVINSQTLLLSYILEERSWLSGESEFTREKNEIQEDTTFHRMLTELGTAISTPVKSSL